MAARVPSASASSFPPRSHGMPLGRARAPSPSPSLMPRRGAVRRLRPVLAHNGAGGGGDLSRILDPLATPSQILGLDASASYSAAELKAAFRARVKEFHPDVCKDTKNADLIMRRVLEAYEILSGNQGMMIKRNYLRSKILSLLDGGVSIFVFRNALYFGMDGDAHILVLKGHLMHLHLQMTLVQHVQYLKVMIMITMSNLLSGNAQESVYAMSRLANALFWRKFLLVC